MTVEARAPILCRCSTRRQILQQSSTLIIHLDFLQVVLSVLFLKKYQKRGSRVRHSVLPLFTNCISISCCNILQSVHTSPLAACRNAWGSKNSLHSNIMLPGSKHGLAARCASQRCPLDKLLMLAAKTQTSLAFARLHVTFRRWRGLTFCNEELLACTTDFNAYNGNIKEKPAPLKDTT